MKMDFEKTDKMRHNPTGKQKLLCPKMSVLKQKSKGEIYQREAK